MHLRSRSEQQGAPGVGAPQVGAPQVGAPRRSSRPRGASALRCPPMGARSWVSLLLGALLVPGAWSFLSESEEELLVELHNFYRGRVSPSASAMMPLKWDPTLKLVAEGYAAKCVWNHNPALDDTGENLFVSSGPLDLRDALEKWFLEHSDFDYQNNSCDEDKMCGHYTQMVWADTHRVGCAFHLCNTMEGLDWERVSFLVCNYFPAGNYEDQRPYVEGDWCSSCPENLQQCENNLCVPDLEEQEEVKEEQEEQEEAEVTMGSSDPPPSASETITAAMTPSFPPPAGGASDSPPAGSTEQNFLWSPTSRAAQQEEQEEQREETVLRKQETFPGSNMSAGSGSVCAAPALLAGLVGLLSLWL